MAGPSKKEVNEWFDTTFLSALEKNHISLDNPMSLLQVRILPDLDKTTPAALDQRRQEISATQPDPDLAQLQVLEELRPEYAFVPKEKMYTGGGHNLEAFQSWAKDSIQPEITEEQKAVLYQLAQEDRLFISPGAVENEKINNMDIIRQGVVPDKPTVRWDSGQKSIVEGELVKLEFASGDPADEIPAGPHAIEKRNQAATRWEKMYNYYYETEERKNRLISSLDQKYDTLGDKQKEAVKGFLQRETSDRILESVGEFVQFGRKQAWIDTGEENPLEMQRLIKRGMTAGRAQIPHPWSEKKAPERTQKVHFNKTVETIVEGDDGTFYTNSERSLDGRHTRNKSYDLTRMNDAQKQQRQEKWDRIQNSEKSKPLPDAEYDPQKKPEKSSIWDSKTKDPGQLQAEKEAASAEGKDILDREKVQSARHNGFGLFCNELHRLYRDLKKTDSKWSHDSDPYIHLKSAISMSLKAAQSFNMENAMEHLKEVKKQAEQYLSDKKDLKSLSSRQVDRLKVINRILDLQDMMEPIMQKGTIDRTEFDKDLIAEKLTSASADINLSGKKTYQKWLTDRTMHAEKIAEMKAENSPFHSFVQNKNPEELDAMIKTNHKALYKQMLQMVKQNQKNASKETSVKDVPQKAAAKDDPQQDAPKML